MPPLFVQVLQYYDVFCAPTVRHLSAAIGNSHPARISPLRLLLH